MYKCSLTYANYKLINTKKRILTTLRSGLDIYFLRSAYRRFFLVIS